jgi:hypothetical protein
MANPTTNYSFVLPTSTDLVTDLPADFDVALQGVDTRLKALQPGTTLGDLAYSSATANTNTRLPIGTTGQVLTVAGGVPTWATGTTGDIEGVTAGTGLSGGGTSGTVTVSIDTAVTADLTTAQTLTNKTLTAPVINLALNAQTGTTYTFVLADNGKLVTASNASAQTYSIPTNATAAFAVGTQINLIQIGAGQVTVAAATPGTTTVLSNAATAAQPKCRNQYAALTAIKVATDTWYVIGDIA